jgi:hypothetical protein
MVGFGPDDPLATAAWPGTRTAQRAITTTARTRERRTDGRIDMSGYLLLLDVLGGAGIAVDGSVGVGDSGLLGRVLDLEDLPCLGAFGHEVTAMLCRAGGTA